MHTFFARKHQADRHALRLRKLGIRFDEAVHILMR
jgi:hypothetical protein